MSPISPVRGGCSRIGAAFYPQFATHNAHTVAAILELAGERRDCEFQRLHGMGEALYEQIVGPEQLDRPCRVYAPVGSHEDLLAYLVRRLLENGANTSFVNRIVDDRAADRRDHRRSGRAPRRGCRRSRIRASRCRATSTARRGKIRAGSTSPIRRRSRRCATALAEAARAGRGRAAPIVGGVEQPAPAEPVFDPSDRRRQVGTVVAAGPAELDRALARAERSAPVVGSHPGGRAGRVLERAGRSLREAAWPS